MSTPPLSSGDPLQTKYEFAPDYERVLTWYCAVSPGFYERVGRFLLPELLGADPAKLALRAIQQICRDHGNAKHPASTVPVVQRVYRWSSEDGTTRIEHAREVHRYLGLDPTKVPTEELVLGELVPILERQFSQIHARYASQAVLPADRDRNLKRARQTLELIESLKAPRVATLDLSRTELSPTLFGSLSEYESRLVYFSTGIPEVDAIVGGGVPVGTLGCVMGRSNAGKSMCGVSLFCSAMRQKLFPIYATLEHSKRKVFTRAKANLTHVPINAILNHHRPEFEREADRRFAWLVENRMISAGHVEKFQGGTTTIVQIFDWVRQVEAQMGRRAHVVFIDADEHLAHPTNKDIGDYKGYQLTYQVGLNEAQGPDPDRNPELMRVIIFFSQLKIKATRTAGDKPRIADHEDGADSSKKGKMSDWVATLNVRGEPPSMRLIWNWSKVRDAPTGMTSELMTNYACGQLVTVQDPWPWLIDPQGWARSGGLDQRELFRET